MAQHVAIKCTYNNADEGKLVGFNGTCTEDIIKSNIENGRIWCSQNDCGCKQYYDMDFKGDKPKDQCYESRLFRDWEYGAGWCHTGKRAGSEVIQIYSEAPGKKIDRPVKELVGFEKVFLKKGEKKKVEIKIKAKDLAFYDVKKADWSIEQGKHILHIGNSSTRIIAKIEITIQKRK